MNQHQSSRRQFLKMSALLPISGLLLSPAIAHFYPHQANIRSHKNADFQPTVRADIRTLEFDSHNFFLNFR